MTKPSGPGTAGGAGHREHTEDRGDGEAAPVHPRVLAVHEDGHGDETHETDRAGDAPATAGRRRGASAPAGRAEDGEQRAEEERLRACVGREVGDLVVAGEDHRRGGRGDEHADRGGERAPAAAREAVEAEEAEGHSR